MNELQMKIIYYKKKLNLTNDDISAVTGLPSATVSRLCTGKTKDPTLKTLKLLAKVFDCTVDDLMGLEGGVEPFYLDKQTGTIALAIKENPNLKNLFNVLKDLSNEDLQALIGIVRILQKNKN